MIYASSAAVVIALLAWDIGRRRIATDGRLNAIEMNHAQNLEGLCKSHNALLDKTENIHAILNDRDNRLSELRKMVVNAAEHTEEQEKRQASYDSGLDKRIEEVASFLTAFDDNHRARLDALEQRPSVDLSKHDAAVLNLAKQLKELSDDVARIKSTQSAGLIASPRNRNHLVG